MIPSVIHFGPYLKVFQEISAAEMPFFRASVVGASFRFGRGHTAALLRSHSNGSIPFREIIEQATEQNAPPYNNNSWYNNKPITAYERCFPC